MRKSFFLFFLVFLLSCTPSRKTTEPAVDNFEQIKDEASTESEIGGPPTKEELIGFWKMRPLSNPSVNKVDPWPVKYQWFSFFENDKVFSFMRSDSANYTSNEILELYQSFPKDKIPNYNLQGQFITIDNPEIENYLELWGINIVRKDRGSFFKKGDLVMSLDDGKGEVVYYRILRRIE
ncbi:MAG: hypothetical protein RLN81_10675 [Balneolaceae bacterium]